MPLLGETGDLRETDGEVRLEWKIPDFFSLSEEVDSYYHSPVFSLSDSCWLLRLYPNGETEPSSSGWIGLYLMREDTGSPKTVILTLGIKKPDGVEEKLSPNAMNVPKKTGRGLSKFILRSELLNRKSQLTPSDILTLTCSLTSDIPHSTEISLFSRLWNVSRNLKTILDEGRRTDFTFKLKDREQCAHKMILESRCGYFAGMFGHELQENTTGKAEIEDIEESVFQCVLYYLYSGEVDGISDQNVCKIYVAADKLLLKELKKLCTEYMKENLCLDLVCDVIAVAEKYEEEELRERAVEYFTQNVADVFDTDAWKKFKVENSPLSSELLESIILERQKTSKTKKLNPVQ